MGKDRIETIETEIIGGIGNIGKSYQEIPIESVKVACFYLKDGYFCGRPGFDHEPCKKIFGNVDKCNPCIKVDPGRTLKEAIEEKKKKRAPVGRFSS